MDFGGPPTPDLSATAIRAFAHRHGADAKYHETITVAWMAVIAERLDETPDLLVTRPTVLSRYYDDATLASDRAQRVFVLPASRC